MGTRTVEKKRNGQIPSFTVLLTIAVAALISFSGFAAICTSDESEAATSGTCGTNLNWTYDSIHKSLTITGAGAMMDDFNISDVLSNTIWGGNKDFTSVSLPSTLQHIGNYAFVNCNALTSVALPNDLKTIGDYAFNNCANLETVTMNGSLLSIGSNAFNQCTDLETIDLPSSVTTLGSSAFYHCTSLTSVSIPSSVTSIGSSAFFECDSLTTVNVICDTPLTLTIGSTDNGYVAYYASAINYIHDYTGVENWSDDGKSCDLTLVCLNDPTHRVSATPRIDADVKTAPTETTKGTTTYSYSYTYDEKTYIGNKDVEDLERLKSGETWTDFSGIVIQGGVTTDITSAFDKANVIGLSMKAIAKTSAGDLSILIDKDTMASMAYSAVTLKANTGNISEISGTGMVVTIAFTGANLNGGKALISIPLNAVIPSDSDIKVYRTNGDGKQDMNAVFENGCLSFETDSLSPSYSVVLEGGSSGGGSSSNGGGNGFPIWIVTLIVGCALGAGAVFLIKQLNAKKE